MHDHVAKYTGKLIRDRIAVPESIRFYVLDDRIVTNREDEWLPVFTRVFSALNVTAILFARTTLPFADFLVQRAGPEADRILPKDSETKTFLHDIPFLRKDEFQDGFDKGLPEKIAVCLRERKAMLIEGIGVIAVGSVTVEQAFNAFCMVFHTTFIKYLLDLLTNGFRLPGERDAFEDFKSSWMKPLDSSGLMFDAGPLSAPDVILREIQRVGAYTVEKGLVDSFFGNISYFDGRTIFISQTASSLDELEGHIVPVALDGSSTAGITASSELPAHRAVYLSTKYHAVLHGHPRFSVILSMHCEEKDCSTEDCGRNCKRRRSACGIPVVPGEIGAGGLAKTVPSAITGCGACIVYGHGVFSAGVSDFREAFMKMMEVEGRCREEYFKLAGK